MSRTRRFTGGVGGQYVYQLLVAVVGFWLAPFLLRHLGNEQYALWLVATQILFYLAVLDFGVVALLPREVAYATGRVGAQLGGADLPTTIGRSMRIVWLQTPFVAAVAALMWMLLPAEWAGLRGPLLLILVLFLALFPFRAYLAVLQGLQQLTFLSIATGVGWAVGTVVTVGLILGGMGLYALVVGWGAGQIVATIACRIRLQRRHPGVLPKHTPRLAWGEIRPQLVNGGWFTIGQLANVLVTGSDILILAKLLPAADVVAYSMTQKLFAVLGNQPVVFLHSAVPGLSELRGSNQTSELARVTIALAQGVLLLGGSVAFVVLAINGPFVTWWVGSDLYLGTVTSAALAANMLIRHWNLSLATPIFTFGYERRWASVWLLDGVLSVAGAILLVPRIGPLGAPLASIAAVLVSSIPLNLALLARETGSTVGSLLRPHFPWAWRLLILMALAVLATRYWNPSSVIVIGITAAAAGILYAAVMYPVARRSTLGPYLERLLGAVRRAARRTEPTSLP